MYRSLLVISALGASHIGAGLPAHAQDARFDWTGAFFGVSVGGMHSEGAAFLDYGDAPPADDTVYFDGNTPYFSDDADLSSPFGWPAAADLLQSSRVVTAEAGYDHQAGHLVYGVAIDASYFGSGATWATSDIEDTANGRTHGITVSGGVEHLYSGRVRLGVAVDRLLLFGTGGLALGRASLETGAYLEQDGGKGSGSAEWHGRDSGWRLGFVAGAGAEYALTDHLSLKVSAHYYDLGFLNAAADGDGMWDDTPLDVSPYEASLALRGAIARVGMNLRY